jgi:hypothetical protein
MKALTRLLVAMLFVLVLATSAFAQSNETYRSPATPLGEGFEMQMVVTKEAENEYRFVLVKFPEIYLTPDMFNEGIKKTLVLIFTCSEFVDCDPVIEDKETVFPNTSTTYKRYVDLAKASRRIVIFPLFDNPESSILIGVALIQTDPIKS